MPFDDILGRVDKALDTAGCLAREAAFAAGQPIVYVNEQGQYIEEHPDGRRFEVRFEPGQSVERQKVTVREIVSHAA